MLPYHGNAKANLDLYKNIQKETGVSLKNAYLASLGKNQSAVDSLKMYSRRIGITEIEKSFSEEIEHREKYCKKNKSPECTQSIVDLKSQISFIKELHSQSNKLPGIRRLYLDLLVFHFRIQTTVLKKDFEEWDKNCSSQEKINTPACKEKLFETHALADISQGISQIALLKSENQTVDPKLLTELKDKISRYETF